MSDETSAPLAAACFLLSGPSGLSLSRAGDVGFIPIPDIATLDRQIDVPQDVLTAGRRILSANSRERPAIEDNPLYNLASDSFRRALPSHRELVTFCKGFALLLGTQIGAPATVTKCIDQLIEDFENCLHGGR